MCRLPPASALCPLAAAGPHHVLFVDDNSDNLNDARRVADVMTFHVTGSTGLSPSMCDYIRAWAK